MAVKELDRHELGVLTEICRTFDVLDALRELEQTQGHLTPDGRIAPWIIEARLQRLNLCRQIASLRLPDDLTQPSRRPQRRGAARGIYRGFSIVEREAQ